MLPGVRILKPSLQRPSGPLVARITTSILNQNISKNGENDGELQAYRKRKTEWKRRQGVSGGQAYLEILTET